MADNPVSAMLASAPPAAPAPQPAVDPAAARERVVASARAALDEKFANKAWVEKFYGGDDAARRSFGVLTARIAGYGDGPTEAGNAFLAAPEDDDPGVATTSGPHGMTARRLQEHVANLFASGLDERSVDQIMKGKPVSVAEYRAALALRDKFRRDQDFQRRLFAGDHEARKQFTLLSAILASEVE
jgi:hypothetical protein